MLTIVKNQSRHALKYLERHLDSLVHNPAIFLEDQRLLSTKEAHGWIAKIGSGESPVFSRLVCTAEFRWREAGIFFEEQVKIGLLRKPDAKADVLQRPIGLEQQYLCLLQ